MAELEQIVESLERMLGTPVTLRSWNESDMDSWSGHDPGSQAKKKETKQPKAGSAVHTKKEFTEESDYGSFHDESKGKPLLEGDIRAAYRDMKPGACFYTDSGEIWFKAVLPEERPAVVVIQADQISETEANLISLLLQNAAQPVLSLPGTPTLGKGEGERRAKRLGAWLNERYHDEEYGSLLPEEFKTKLAVTEEMIPFLLVNESHHEADVSYKALQRLLRSYFDGEIVLIPLEESEWLFLADPRLLEGLSDEKEDQEDENGQDLLSLFCMGLYELISSEWVGDFHVAAIPQVKVMDQLVEGLRLLRETLLIGRTFNVKEHIHLSDGLHLERLLYSIPDEQRTRFLEEYASHHLNVFEDEETVSTLESFFELDCNVSETAKRLYIHRNTLLYRLDKIKQETGLDVRSFSDAVLVKLTLLLYKLTKRK